MTAPPEQRRPLTVPGSSPGPPAPPPDLLRVLGLQLAGHFKQQVLVVDDLQLPDVGLGLEVGGGRLCVQGCEGERGHRGQQVGTHLSVSVCVRQK